MVDLPSADGAYDRPQLIEKAAYLDFVVQVIIRRRDEAKGFEALPVDGSWSGPSAG